MQGYEVIGAGAGGFGALLVALRRLRWRMKNDPETIMVLGIASMHAGERGHRVCTVPHVALALLSDPDVAALLEQRGASVDAIYADLEHLIPARGDSPVTLQRGDHTAGVVSLLRACTAGKLGMRPRHLLGPLLGSEHPEIRSVFEKHGITAARLRQPPPRRDAPANDGTTDRAPGPYRSAPTSNATTDVLFWDDSKTSMPFVVETLRVVFGIVEPRSTALMLRTHRDGVARVGTYEREQAEALVATSMRLAKERGFPLRVTTEEASRRKSMGPVARWLHRRASRMDVPLAAAEAPETPPSESR